MRGDSTIADPETTLPPLAIDLFCGLGGWTEGLLAEGYEVVGFDIERHIYGEHRYPAQLVLQDVTTLDGRQFKDAALIVASPPCQAYSYRAMPWKRAKALPPPENALFDACFRIQREACEAAGHHIPMVVENVRGAQPWVGRARWNFGSYFLWGDVPALMPMVVKAVKVGGLDWSKYGQPDYKTSGAAGCFRDSIMKNAGGLWFRASHNNVPPSRGDALFCPDADRGVKGFTPHGEPLGQNKVARLYGSKSPKRKMASAMIAKIPLTLSRYIAAVYKPVPKYAERATINPEKPTP